MKIKYELNGMTCGDCLSNVKQALLKVPEVKKVEVQLIPQSVILTMDKAVSVDKLQTQLSNAGHYTIKETHHNRR